MNAPRQPSQGVTAKTQSIRLATTMTGGVSLAIWMGGIAREINLVSQASAWRRKKIRPDQWNSENPKRGRYQRRVAGVLPRCALRPRHAARNVARHGFAAGPVARPA